ncbi:MAG: CatB-related O-acetyltransferase [Magnetococcales bacterium]|nr:CatB-related O-acetyltransferase [Magnetococcales bacterium]
MIITLNHAESKTGQSYYLPDGHELVTIGPYSYIFGQLLVDFYGQHSHIRIGKFCSIKGPITFLTGGSNHRSEWISTYPFLEKAQLFDDSDAIYRTGKKTNYASGPTTIGNDVWIGYDCSIREGVTVGDGAIIGMKALVAKDVPPYSVVGGVPARILRYRFSQKIIERLLKVQWWHWPAELIEQHTQLLCSLPDEAQLEQMERIAKG